MIRSKTKPAVGYVRMSSDQQEDSPARQRSDVEALEVIGRLMSGSSVFPQPNGKSSRPPSARQ